MTDEAIALQIVDSLAVDKNADVLEIGPGTGVLTKSLLQQYPRLKAMDVDFDSIEYLKKHYPDFEDKIVHENFLKCDIDQHFKNSFSVIGNFPYNISSQIFFKVLDHINKVDVVVCMLQREVADRIASPPGKKAYGILSVFLQAYYKVEKLFDVPPDSFNPPPKVWSSVIRLERNSTTDLKCDEKQFRKVVKAGFQMRRKTLRNALKGLNLPAGISTLEVFNKRAEQLSVADFVDLTKLIYGDE